MDDPIFVKTGEYPSYTDFWELVRLSGFPVEGRSSVNLDLTRTYVFPTLDQDMMSCFDGRPRGKRNATAIFWNMERPDANLRPGMDVHEVYHQATDEILSFVDRIWVSDRCVHAMDPRQTFVVLGGHPDLVQRAEPVKPSDVVHIGQVTERRREILRHLKPYVLLHEASSYGQERAKALRGARLMIGIDRVEGLHFSASLRWIVAAACRLPVLQEAVDDPYPLVRGKSILMAPYGDLVEKARMTVDLMKPGELASIGDAAYQTYCLDWTFRRGVEEAMP